MNEEGAVQQVRRRGSVIQLQIYADSRGVGNLQGWNMSDDVNAESRGWLFGGVGSCSNNGIATNSQGS